MLPPKNSPAFASIASGSLSNKIFPPEKEIYTALLQGINSWTKHHGLPTLPRRHVMSLWDSAWKDHVTDLTDHITHKDIKKFRSFFPNAVLQRGQEGIIAPHLLPLSLLQVPHQHLCGREDFQTSFGCTHRDHPPYFDPTQSQVWQGLSLGPGKRT